MITATGTTPGSCAADVGGGMGAKVPGTGAGVWNGASEGAADGLNDGAYVGPAEIALPIHEYCLYVTFNEYPGGEKRH